ncbi:MAG: EscU/YscU/HrcU family type III secretion system export apparatus switch protein [Bdellovibrionales bacterium]|nr:EscU/YscU/HrcU family type III secretion system export apparatus switch protein [Bdellovibrionales bacterium]
MPTLEVAARGAEAIRLRQLARRYGVPISEHDVLARDLSLLAPDDAIPPELYAAIADVLVRSGDS